MPMLISNDTEMPRLEMASAYSILMTDYENILKENHHLKLQDKESQKKITNLEEEVVRLKEQLRLMQHRQFGKKSEIQVGEPPLESTGDPDPLIVVTSHTRKKKKNQGRLLDPSNLPRFKIYHDLPGANKACSCCQNLLSKIGEEVSEQLEVLPLRLYVAEHIRFKYTCRSCETIIMAPKPKAPIQKALAGGSLLTEVIISKYQYHLPLYRQSKIMASYDITIPDNTLGNWVMQSGTGLMPIYNALWQVILKTIYLQVDETPVKVLKSDKKGYLWAYFAPYVSQGLVIFELSLTRGGCVAETRLSDFRGLLQTDGYGGYNKLRKRKDIVGFGCLTHARRKFDEVLKVTKNAPGIAAEFIKRVKPLYDLEEKMRELNLSFHTRKRLRQKQAWPILKSLHPWLKQQQPKVPPNSKVGGAIQYTLNQWKFIIMYLRHGAAEIDTNYVENLIRPTALGRKNWLFMGNEDSGLIHALWYSLILSAIRNNLNPRVYIHFLLTKIHDLRTGLIDPIDLLPHTIDRMQLIAFANEQIALSKEVIDST